jgi:hypothetical protein
MHACMLPGMHRRDRVHLLQLRSRVCRDPCQPPGTHVTPPPPILKNSNMHTCRRPDQHEGAYPEGAINVPMYRLIDMQQADLAKVGRC